MSVTAFSRHNAEQDSGELVLLLQYCIWPLGQHGGSPDGPNEETHAPAEQCVALHLRVP